MKCPYCGADMEEGFLQGTARVAWVKKKHLISLLPKAGEILLENNAVSDFLFPAQICKRCQKIIFDYQGKAIQEG